MRPRILFTCGREASYVRNALILRALRSNFDVIDVVDNYPGSLLLRNVRLLPRLLRARPQEYDLVFAGFYGHLLTVFLRSLTRKPIVFDAFLSTWDTLCFDRKRFSPDSLPGRLAFRLDRGACSAADHCLLDTETHKRYFVETFAVPESRISTLYVGYDQELFVPRDPASGDGRFVVFYYGSFLPLQGLEHIVGAARLLAGETDIQFLIVGEGMTYAQVRRQAERLRLDNLTFQPVVPYEQLPALIAQASICLGGPFGSSAKASRVIAGKTFQFLGMAKPTVLGDSPANRELFTHGEDALMCRMADPQSLASAILELRRDAALRGRIAWRGHARVHEEFTVEKQGQRLRRIIEGLL